MIIPGTHFKVVHYLAVFFFFSIPRHQKLNNGPLSSRGEREDEIALGGRG